ncbi:TetR/AcrR family transcriptional regulator [Dactylosporangium sp. CA-233914]|uniref:TetR/AcrR family transcriptional regulator n=1 Tax=Dactylosporangium sp. CA-233914 TaxID=3239934 RepID=UPI003D931F0D
MTAAAAALFAGRVYDGVSADDLVQQLGVHRNSSKRGLYLAALRWYLEYRLPMPADRLAAGATVANDPTLDLLLAAVERAPVDAEVAVLVARAWQVLEQALQPSPAALSALLGERLLVRAARSVYAAG